MKDSERHYLGNLSLRYLVEQMYISRLCVHQSIVSDVWPNQHVPRNCFRIGRFKDNFRKITISYWNSLCYIHYHKWKRKIIEGYWRALHSIAYIIVYLRKRWQTPTNKLHFVHQWYHVSVKLDAHNESYYRCYCCYSFKKSVKISIFI